VGRVFGAACGRHLTSAVCETTAYLKLCTALPHSLRQGIMVFLDIFIVLVMPATWLLAPILLLAENTAARRAATARWAVIC